MKTCARWMASSCLIALLAGCGGMFGLSSKPQETVTVAGRSVVIGGAPGYCVDRAASRLLGESPFVLMGSCASISGDPRAASPSQPGILTAAVSAPATGPGFAQTLPEFKALLSSRQGRAALARDGNAASVTILDTREAPGALLIRLRDTSSNTVPGVGPTYWRGLFEVRGRLVTVSVMEFDDQPMGSDGSLATLQSFIARIRAETARL